MYTTSTPIDCNRVFSYNRNKRETEEEGIVHALANRNIRVWIFFGKCVNSNKKKYFQKGR